MGWKRSAVPWIAVLGATVFAPAAPTHALRVLLDHNTDGRLDTFQNVAVAESVPVDVIVLVEPGDENLDALHSVVVS